MQEQRPWSIILFNRVLHMFDPDRLKYARRALSPPIRYPDGSLQFDFANSDEAKWSLHEDLQMTPLYQNGLLKQAISRSLAPFPEKWFTLIYSEEYRKRLGEEYFVAGIGSLALPGEENLRTLQFTITFTRRVTRAVQKAFVEDFGKHLASLCQTGVLSEGPLLPNPPEVHFKAKRADIWLDASLTGMVTLMSLVLRALEFGHEVATVDGATFNQNDPAGLQLNLESLRNLAKLDGRAFDEAAAEEVRQEWEGRGPTTIVPLPNLGSG